MTAFLTILGSGVVAAVVSGLVAVLTQSRGFSREDRIRWMAERRDAYAALLESLEGMSFQAFMMFEGRDLTMSVASVSTAYVEHHDAAQGPIARLQLLAGDEARRRIDAAEYAAGELLSEMFQAEKEGLAGNVGVAGTRAALSKARMESGLAANDDLGLAIDALLKAARRDIGVR